MYRPTLLHSAILFVRSEFCTQHILVEQSEEKALKVEIKLVIAKDTNCDRSGSTSKLSMKESSWRLPIILLYVSRLRSARKARPSNTRLQ